MELDILELINSKVEAKKKEGYDGYVRLLDIQSAIYEKAKEEMHALKELGFLKLRRGLNEWYLTIDEGDGEET